MKNHPSPLTREFTDYLRNNNKVVEHGDAWIMIENCKYHTNSKPHYTLFSTSAKVESLKDLTDFEMQELREILGRTNGFVYINTSENRSIERFHLHIAVDYDHWVKTVFIKSFKHKFTRKVLAFLLRTG